MVIRTNRSFRLPLSLAVAVGVFVVGIYSYTTLATSFSASREADAQPGSAVVTVSQPAADAAEPSTTITTASLLGSRLYVDPRLSQAGRPAAIANQPTALWLGDWTTDIAGEVSTVMAAAQERGEMASFVLYNIPQRDCGLYSAGGASDSAAYRQWIDQFTASLGQRPAVVILEPDALMQLDCLSSLAQTSRLSDLNYALAALSSQTSALTYIDAGHNGWKPASTVVGLLRQLDLKRATGFALNVSNFNYTKDVADYGDAIARELGGTRYVIDTSRNGAGPAPDNAWCNPTGRALGAAPTTSPSYGQYADAYLWIKTPGESDGDADGAPKAGQWYQDYAQMLIDNAVKKPTNQ